MLTRSHADMQVVAAVEAMTSRTNTIEFVGVKYDAFKQTMAVWKAREYLIEKIVHSFAGKPKGTRSHRISAGQPLAANLGTYLARVSPGTVIDLETHPPHRQITTGTSSRMRRANASRPWRS